MQGSTQLSSNTYGLCQSPASGNNRFWQLPVPARNTNLAGGLSNGSYSVMFTTTTSTGTFSVVPAPGAIALLGAAGIVGARKRR